MNMGTIFGPLTWPSLVFLGVVGWVFLAVVAATTISAPSRKVARISALGAGLWLVLSAVPTWTGVLRADGPVPPQPLMMGSLAVAVWFGMSGTGGRIVGRIPLWAIVGFQGFRLPLEIVLHEWVTMGVAPPQMTWTGQNFDIIAGLVALASIPLVARSPRLAWVPTIVGSVLLLNILRIVITSFPGPLQRFDDTLMLPFLFPHVWIATICVAGAVAGHIMALRALARMSAEAVV